MTVASVPIVSRATGGHKPTGDPGCWVPWAFTNLIVPLQVGASGVAFPWRHGNSLELAMFSCRPAPTQLAIPRIGSLRPAFGLHHPDMVERLRSEAHAGRRPALYLGEAGLTGGRQAGPKVPDPT